MTRAAGVLEPFRGEWRLERRIEDRRAGETGVFLGRAVLTPAADGLVYAEAGELRLPGRAPLRAERRYLWAEAGGRIVVRFADGRAFHDFAPGQEAAAEHLCGADLYRVRYGFAAWPEWTALWEVTGPRKDYALESRYRPVAG
jgi:hypothetical protein